MLAYIVVMYSFLLKNNIVCSVIIAVMQWWVTLNCSSLPSVSNGFQIHTHRINFRCLNVT